MHEPERVHAVVIGGGQAGLSVGYQLAQRGVGFVILDAHERIGDAWRQRWDSLRLFSPARFDGLAGMPFPAPANAFPTKDEMADYLEAYAARFDLPVRTGVRVDGLSRRGGRYLVTAGDRSFEAEQVIVAMSSYQSGRVPAFASELVPGITQLHSKDYRNPSQLRDGAVLVVGAGNSGAEIALEVARSGHPTWVSGRDVGQIPFRIGGLAARLFLARLVFRLVFHRLLTLRTPLGRKAHLKQGERGVPLIRTKAEHLAAAGIRRAPRVVGVRDGLPLLEGGRPLPVANVIWCTGFHPGFSWIDLPIFGDDGAPRHERGVVAEEPGLYFVGLHFLYALSSAMVHGVGRDAEYVAEIVAARARAPRLAGGATPSLPAAVGA
ncbi:flavin-containing monooxygenase [Anaeromyxobacter oryzae]|uniref:Oxidoreductase n=1 Tax=Anaeromyxobacter oryzae TaxID=2918170 RepID=A0ABM7X1I2_9BACT|nr:NAD(P)-binding domain-containing protein [Anaeromyxobacter oryzae]BDG05647.1 oxidoreductase [Anaeromyxobacter oryzae]